MPHSGGNSDPDREVNFPFHLPWNVSLPRKDEQSSEKDGGGDAKEKIHLLEGKLSLVTGAGKGQPPLI